MTKKSKKINKEKINKEKIKEQINNAIKLSDNAIKLSEKYGDDYSIKINELSANGIGVNKAKEFIKKGCKMHQLRKYLITIKNAAIMVKSNKKNFIKAKKSLYEILPEAANHCADAEELFYFLAEHINDKAIEDAKDVIILDELFSSICAYYKIIKIEEGENENGSK